VEGLKSQIVAFLNGRGGIILVGCRANKERIFPHKEEVAEHHKEQIEAKLQKYVSLITPAVNTNRNIIIKFLPLARSPLASPNPHPDFIQGAYILRIVVAPSEAQHVFYFIEEATATKTTVTNHFYRQDGQHCLKLQGENIYDFMKTRYHQVAKPHFGTLLHCPLPALTPHHDACRQPDKGKPEYGDA
jgi:predicted HTH transcriptional regulator